MLNGGDRIPPWLRFKYRSADRCLRLQIAAVFVVQGVQPRASRSILCRLAETTDLVHLAFNRTKALHGRFNGSVHHRCEDTSTGMSMKRTAGIRKSVSPRQVNSPRRARPRLKPVVPSKAGPLWQKIVVGIVVAFFGALVRTIFVSQPQVAIYDAQTFFHNYYENVTSSSQRKMLYRRDLTLDFQRSPGHDWRSYESFWGRQEAVVVQKIESIPGNPLAFNVSLAYYPKGGGIDPEDTIFSLVCNGSYSWLSARIPGWGCPASDIQIESGYDVSSSSP